MADETLGSAPGYETKDLPGGYAVPAVPQPDKLTIDATPVGDESDDAVSDGGQDEATPTPAKPATSRKTAAVKARN
jgi:hypothetical protein